MFWGRPNTCRPEQADGRPVDVRSDLYSLGAVMYALLARRPLFRGKSLVEVLHKQRFEQPEPLGTYAADTPEEFQRILTSSWKRPRSGGLPTPACWGDGWTKCCMPCGRATVPWPPDRTGFAWGSGRACSAASASNGDALPGRRTMICRPRRNFPTRRVRRNRRCRRPQCRRRPNELRLR